MDVITTPVNYGGRTHQQNLEKNKKHYTNGENMIKFGKILECLVENDGKPPDNDRIYFSEHGDNKQQMNIVVFRPTQLQHEKIHELRFFEKEKSETLTQDELTDYIGKRLTKETSDESLIAVLDMIRVTSNPQEVLKILNKCSTSSKVSIQKRKLAVFQKTLRNNEGYLKKSTVIHFQIDIESDDTVKSKIQKAIKNIEGLRKTEYSQSDSDKEENQIFDQFIGEKADKTKDEDERDFLKKPLTDELKSESIKTLKERLRKFIKDDEHWPMNSIQKVPLSSVPPLCRSPIFLLTESKRHMMEEHGLHFSNEEVMLPFLTIALNEALEKKIHLRPKVIPKRVMMPEDVIFEHLSLFKHSGIPLTIMTYHFFQEVNGMMENHFNRLASFKDWPLSAPVSALRLVDSGFYFDVQKSSVACYACKLHIETRELSSLLEGDTVLNMHLRLSENCFHALQQKKDKEGIGNFVLPFHKPKSEMNTGIFSSSIHGGLQIENSNPVPEMKNLGISEKNGSNTHNIFQPYIGATSENINVQQQDKISNITRDFFFNKNEETYPKYDSGYNSQKGISHPTENVSDARGLPIQTASTDSLSYMAMLSEDHLQPHSLFGEDTIAATAESLEMETTPSPGIPIHDSNEIKKSSTNASLFDTIATEEEPSYSMRHPDYKTVESRLRTFVFWPFNDKQNKVLLVQCGFFFTGQQDIVRCFACDIGLAEWDETDDPWSEHARHSPHCKYLKKMKGQDFINRVQQEWRKIYNPKTPQMQDFNRRLESFQTDKWPSSITQTPKQIAEAGFYFTGEEDAVRCHYCDGGLREWEPGDDPWTEHARWFPFCKFVMKIKGIQFIDEIQQKYEMGAGNLDSLPQSGCNTAGPGKPSEEDNNPICSQAARSLISMGYSKVKVQHVIDRFVAEKGHNDYTTSNLLDLLLEMEDKGETFPPEATVQPQSKPTSQGPGNIASFTETSESEQELDPEIIEEENQRLKKQLLCVKCEKSERVIVFTPCGHRLVCKPCSEPMKKCIKCKKKIQKKVKTFLC
ncbi:uncharacterized protein LOC134277573 [Saccostrea cucullata]|uniref:uncharacterized protein LOC134277573 n=1 Tax=Saccostrea cuccullata TaxID=36930 RepID=UPI002ED57CB7